MILSGRRLLLSSLIVIAAVAIVIAIKPQDSAWLSIVVAAVALAGIIVLNVYRPAMPMRFNEPDDVVALSEHRRRELIRGTSMHLREMRYRYSIRPVPEDSSDRSAFNAEVNTVKLGFVPAIILDNTNDRQGYGYVAFVYDGHRWRGPGLPCPDGQAEAVRHAARCVSPLATDEETSY